MSITDMIKNSVLEKFNMADLTTTSIVVTLGMAAVMGLFIHLFYRVTTKQGFYNRGFNCALATLPVITAGIMLAMQSNLVISLGMVGALSIVRFRNAVKDPLDLTYLFWSISVGIVAGAGLFELVVLLSLCVTALVSMLNLLPIMRAPCLLVVSCDGATEESELLSAIKNHARHFKIRSCNRTKNETGWIFELRVKDSSALLQDVIQTSGVYSANVLSHDGEVRF